MSQHDNVYLEYLSMWERLKNLFKSHPFKSFSISTIVLYRTRSWHCLPSQCKISVMCIAKKQKCHLTQRSICKFKIVVRLVRGQLHVVKFVSFIITQDLFPCIVFRLGDKSNKGKHGWGSFPGVSSCMIWVTTYLILQLRLNVLPY